jgi:hypothetical protein
MNDREVKISSWISKIYPDFKFQKWSSEKVIIEENIIDYSFFKDTGNVYLAKINPKDIVGIRRIGYIYGDQTSWLNLFYSLKRLKEVFEKNKCLEDLIQHINNPEIGKKTVVKYNGCYFIGLGLHRLCLSKILELKEVEVEVNEFFLTKQNLIFSKLLESLRNISPQFNFP